MTRYTNNKVILFKFIAIFFISIAASSVCSQSLNSKFKALYIYSFAKYITWESPSPVFLIGVVGDSEVITFLNEGLNDRKIGGKTVEIVMLENVSEAQRCDIVYLPESASKELQEILAIIDTKPILLVAEDDLAKKGAGISFYIKESKLKFKINQGALRKSRLKVSEGLLNLGTLI